MMNSRLLLAVAALAATAGVAAAQPSDKQIKKDLTSKGTLKVKLVGNGTVQLNADTLTYEYVRGAEILSTTEYKGVKLLVTGDAVYQKAGKKYRYWKFRVIENRYDGIPNPTAQEIDALLATDPVAAFGEGYASSIVKVAEPAKLAGDPSWFWHTPTSVSFQMTAKVDTVASYTELETELVTLDVRLYRDKMEDPWKSFLVSPAKREPLGRTKYTSDEINKMPRLSQQAAEVKAKAAVAKLPAVTVPDFATVEDLARFVHTALRTGPRDKAEASLRAVLAPKHFASGSTVLLSSSGAPLVRDTLAAAFDSAGKYADQYCAKPVFDARGSSINMKIIGVKDNIVSEITAVKAGGKLVDGQEVGAKWMVEDIKIRTRDDDATRQWVASFSDHKKLCPND